MNPSPKTPSADPACRPARALKAAALCAALSALAGCQPPPVALPLAPPVAWRPPTPYTLEIAADEPLGHWRLDEGAEGALRCELDGAAAFDGAAVIGLPVEGFGGDAFTVELWTRAVERGTLLSYSAPSSPTDALALQCDADGNLNLTLQNLHLPTTATCGDAVWKHLAVIFDGAEGTLTVTADGHPAWSADVNVEPLPLDGVLALGQRQRCPGGCLEDGLMGLIDEVAVHGRALPTSRLLGHVIVGLDLADPAAIDDALPLRLQPQLAHNDALNTLAFSPDGALLASAGHGNIIKLWSAQSGALLNDLRPPSQAPHVAVAALAFSPDGRTLASASWDKAVRLWDPSTGAMRRELIRHTDTVHDVLFSPNGRWLASISQDNTLKLWDPRSGALKLDLPLDDTQAPARRRRSLPPLRGAAAFGPDGRLIVAADLDGAARAWELPSGTLRATLGPHQAPILTVAFHPDGDLVALGSADGAMTLWEPRQGLLRHTLKHGAEVTAARFSPDGRTLAALSLDQQITLWDPATGKTLHRLQNRGDAAVIDFSPDSKVLSAAFDDLSVAHFDARTGAILSQTPGHFAALNIVALDPRRRIAAFVGEGPAIELRDAHTGALLHALDQTPHQVRDLSFSLDGALLAEASQGDAVNLWDTRTGALARHIDLDPDSIGLVALSPDGRLLAATDDRFSVQRFDASTGDRLPALSPPHADTINALAFSPDGRLLATASDDRTIKLWEAATGALLHSLTGHVDRVTRLAFSPDGRLLASTGNDLDVRLWAANSGAPVRTMSGHAMLATTLAFSPDGALLASAGWDRAIKVWDVTSGALVADLTGHEGAINALAFSPTKGWLASASDDRAVKLWSLGGGRLLRDLGRHASNANAVAFSPDGASLASASWDRTVKLWDPSSGALIEEINAHASSVSALAFSPDGRLLATGGGDGAIRLRNLATDATTALLSSGGRWLAFEVAEADSTSGGVFDASLDGASLAAMIQGRRAFGVEQLAMTHNRPDLLIERLGGLDDHLPAPLLQRHLAGLDAIGSSAQARRDERERLRLLQAHYKARHLRRLKAAGLEPPRAEGARVELPQARILQASVGDGGIARLVLDLSDRAGLAGHQITVNGVPVERRPRPTAGRRARVERDVILTRGANRIEVAAFNTRGQESSRAALTLERADAPPRSLIFVGFGVSDYLHDDLPDLQYAHQDVIDLARHFREMGEDVAFQSKFNKIEIHTFIDAAVTPAQIAEVRALLAAATEHDTLVLFVAGHGVRGDDEVRTYYYLPHGARLGDLAGTAVPFEEIEALLDDARPRQKLFLMDTCQSGEVEEEIGAGGVAAGGRGLRGRAVPGMAARTAKAFGVGGALGVGQLDMDRFIYADPTRRSGAVVFASSRGKEASLEGPEFENGVFTEALLMALRGDEADGDGDGMLSTGELRSYVGGLVPRLTEGRQHPTVDRDNLRARIALPLLSR